MMRCVCIVKDALATLTFSVPGIVPVLARDLKSVYLKVAGLGNENLRMKGQKKIESGFVLSFFLWDFSKKARKKSFLK